MNLGQYLTQYSPLPSGTVAEHLLAIASRIGSGQGTVFVSRLNTLATRNEVSAFGITRGSIVVKRDRHVEADAKQKNAWAYSVDTQICVLHTSRSVYALSKHKPTTSAFRSNESATSKPRY